MLHSTEFLGAHEARWAFVVNLLVVVAIVALTAVVPARWLGIPVAIGAAVLILTAGAIALPGGQAWPIAMAVLTLAALWCIGDVALSASRPACGNLRTQGIVSLALGTGIAGAALLILGYIGIVRWWTVGIATVGFGVAGIIRFLRSRAMAISALPRSLTSGRIRAGIASLLCVQASWALVWAAAPEVMYDPLYAKAWLPAQWASHGGPLDLATHPMNGAAGIGPVLAVPGHTLWAPDIGRYLEYLLAAVLICGVWRVVDRRNRVFAPIAAAIVATAPHVIWQAGSANDDLLISLVALGTALAVIQLARGGEERNSASDLVVGALIGTCLLTKLHLGAFAIALGVAWLVARALWREGWWRPPILVASGAFLIAAPDFLYRWFETGNPLLPFYNAVFRSRYWPIENSTFDFPYLKAGDLRTLVGLPWRILDQSATLLQTAPPGVFGVLLVPLLLYLLLGWRKPRGKRLVWVAFMIATIYWLLEVRYLRYLLPYAIIGAALGPDLLSRPMWTVHRRVAETIGIAAVGFAFVAFFATTLAQYWNVPGLKPPTEVAFGGESRLHYEHRAFPELDALEAFNRLAGKGSAAVTDGRWAYQRTKVRDDLYLEPAWLANARLALPINAVNIKEGKSGSTNFAESDVTEFEKWQRLGFDWIILGFEERSFSEASDPRAGLLRSHGVIRFAANGFDLYEIVRDPTSDRVVQICDPGFSTSEVCWNGFTSDGETGLTLAEVPTGATQAIAVCAGETLTVRPTVRNGSVGTSVTFLRSDGTTAEWEADRPGLDMLTIASESGDALHATAPPRARSAMVKLEPSDGAVVDQVQVSVRERPKSKRAGVVPAPGPCAPTGVGATK